MNKGEEMDEMDEWNVNSSDSYSKDPDFEEYNQVSLDLKLSGGLHMVKGVLEPWRVSLKEKERIA